MIDRLVGNNHFSNFEKLSKLWKQTLIYDVTQKKEKISNPKERGSDSDWILEEFVVVFAYFLEYLNNDPKLMNNKEELYLLHFDECCKKIVDNNFSLLKDQLIKIFFKKRLNYNLESDLTNLEMLKLETDINQLILNLRGSP